MDRVIAFVKAPRPGTVKTRLAATVGSDVACARYQELVAAVLGNISNVPNVELRFAPDDALAEIAPWLRPGWRAVAQGEGDLGARLLRAFADAFSAGAERVCIIGSDCPEVSAQDIADAFAVLAKADVCLGPAADGGYWLIGLRQHCPALFANMPWSTDAVLSETLARARRADLSVGLLRQLSDIDTEEDWNEWQQREVR